MGILMIVTSKSSLATGAFLSSGLLILGLYLVWGYTDALVIQPTKELQLTPYDRPLATWFDRAGNGFIVGTHGLILHTTDGGRHWASVTAPARETLSSVSFFDSSHGVIGGGNGVILTTSDGGLSWQRRSSGTSQRLLKVQALDEKHQYAVGAFGTFLSSEDGGASWKDHKLPWDRLVARLAREFGSIEPNLNSVYFISPERGWIVGEFGLILRTDDGGATWQSSNCGSDQPQLYDITFRGESGWAVGQHGTLIQTNNGGGNWISIPLPTYADLETIAITNNWLVALGDNVAIVLGGAANESPVVASHIDNSVLSGAAWASHEPIAVGAAGTILPIRVREFANINERPSSLAVH